MNDVGIRLAARPRAQGKGLVPKGKKASPWEADNDPEAEALRMLEALYPSMKPTAASEQTNGTAIPKSGKFPQRHMETATEAEGSGSLPPSNVDNVDNVDKGNVLRLAAREWLEAHPHRR